MTEISAELRGRIFANIFDKLFLSVALYIVVLGPYFLAQTLAGNNATVMPVGLVEELIPFKPELAWVYLSIIFYLGIGPFLTDDRRELYCYAFGVSLQAVLAFLIFISFPTASPRPEPVCGDCLYAFLTAVDRPFNSFPSLHAALTLYSFLWANRVLSQISKIPYVRLGIAIWGAAILYATIATRQHVFIDIVAGVIMAAVTYRALSLAVVGFQFQSIRRAKL